MAIFSVLLVLLLGVNCSFVLVLQALLQFIHEFGESIWTFSSARSDLIFFVHTLIWWIWMSFCWSISISYSWGLDRFAIFPVDLCRFVGRYPLLHLPACYSNNSAQRTSQIFCRKCMFCRNAYFSWKNIEYSVVQMHLKNCFFLFLLNWTCR